MRTEETHKENSSIWDRVRELGALPPEIDDEGNVEYKVSALLCMHLCRQLTLGFLAEVSRPLTRPP